MFGFGQPLGKNSYLRVKRMLIRAFHITAHYYDHESHDLGIKMANDYLPHSFLLALI